MRARRHTRRTRFAHGGGFHLRYPAIRWRVLRVRMKEYAPIYARYRIHAAMICPNCQTPNAANARFCQNCGQPLARVCANCGAINPPDARFCNQCGTPLTEVASAPVTLPPTADTHGHNGHETQAEQPE